MPGSSPTRVSAAQVRGLSRDLGTGQPDLSAWLLSRLADAHQIETYLSRIGSIPVGTNLTFALGDVDDEAILRFEGLTQRVKRGDRPGPVVRTVLSEGPNAIILEVANSGGGAWSAQLTVTPPGGYALIDHADGGRDEGRTMRRIYIWQFTGTSPA